MSFPKSFAFDLVVFVSDLDLGGRTAWGEVPTGRYYLCVGGERLDQVAHAAYGVQLGALEALLVTNPGIADYGVHLPKGLAVVLPELLATRGSSREVALWG